MVLHLNLVGGLCVGLALIHGIFPRYFDWTNELRSLSLINRQLMYVHTFFIAVGVLLIGLLCLTSATDLTTTALGRRVSLGLAFFWLLRLVFQVAVYSPLLWRGKRLETTVHVLFCFLWTYFTGVFFAAYQAGL